MIGGSSSYDLHPSIGSSGVVESFTTLNTGWSFFIACGSLRQYAKGPTYCSTIKGLRH